MMAVQLPIKATPTYLTVKALAQRWGVDRDYIAAMIGDGTLEAYVAFTPQSHKLFNVMTFTPVTGLYRLASSRAFDISRRTKTPEIRWIGRRTTLPGYEKSAPNFLLPTKKKEISKLIFSFTAEITVVEGPLDEDGQPHDVYWEYENMVGIISDFMIHKSHAQLIEQIATQEEIQAGEMPKAITSRRIILTVINALCENAGIDPRGRSATAEIMRLLDGQGTPASERTVRDAIKQIPDAMKTRKTEQ
jgi:hypothetical protein